jgi:hypothetical protein
LSTILRGDDGQREGTVLLKESDQDESEEVHISFFIAYRKPAVLFVSIDLDFFYNGACTPGDILFVFDRLPDFSLRRGGKILWALCVSRA